MRSKDPERCRVFQNIESLILASASPRRRELLRSVGLTFEVVESGVEEHGDNGAGPAVLARRWAAEKAGAVSRDNPECWVLAADTVVVLENRIFGKPVGPREAEAMLRELSGKQHEVVSGLCLTHKSKGITRVDSILTQVLFKDLGDTEIEAYVKTGEPLDKAGAYGIQGMGAFLVRSLNGSYTNVVGLPLCETLDWLVEEGVITPVVGSERVRPTT